MKHSVIFLMWGLAAFAAAGCADDGATAVGGPENAHGNGVGGDAVAARFAINAPAPDGAGSRTQYGVLADGSWPIYWSEGDRVRIMCGATSPQSAVVALTDVGYHQTEADFGDTGMEWGSAESGDFYAFYPADAVSDNGGSSVKAVLPSVQTNGNGGCNTDYAFMVAAAEGVGRGEEAELDFRPVTTAVTVRLDVAEAAEIQKIVLSSDDALAGTFDYDIATGECTVDGERSSRVLALHMRTGESPYLRLAWAGDRAEVTAFLLPHDIHGLTVSVHTSDGKVRSVSTDRTLRAGYRYSFTVGTLQNAEAADVGPDWMRYMPDNVYLSRVSVPGSHDACAIWGDCYERRDDVPDDRYNFKWLFAGTNITKATKAQELDIEGQLAAGVRMFDLRPCVDGAGVTDPAIHHGISPLGDASLGHAENGGRNDLELFRLSAVLARFVDFLKGHPDETVMVHMKYENTLSMYEDDWRRCVAMQIRDVCDGRIVDFDPLMTLGEARGKILFVLRPDCADYNGGSPIGAHIDWTGDKEVFTTRMTGAGGAASVICNDLYALRDGNGSGGDGRSKYEAIDACLEYVRGSDDPSRWAVNYTSCYDTSHCSITGLEIFRALGDIDYCANIYNRYAAEKIAADDFRGSTGIVMMDFAGAPNATMTYGQSWSNLAVYGDELVRAIVSANNKWPLLLRE